MNWFPSQEQIDDVCIKGDVVNEMFEREFEPEQPLPRTVGLTLNARKLVGFGGPLGLLDANLYADAEKVIDQALIARMRAEFERYYSGPGGSVTILSEPPRAPMIGEGI